MRAASATTGRRRGARLRGLLALTLLGLMGAAIVGQRYRSVAARRPLLLEEQALPKTQKAVEAVTADYFEALRRGQYAHALAFCSAEFRRTQSPDTFRETLHRNFQPFVTIDRPLQFQPAQEGGGMIRLPVQMHCRDGHPYRAFLFWQREADGWRLGRISGPMRADVSQLMMPSH